MHREKAVGVSFRDGIMEVAFEQRTQRADASVDFDVTWERYRTGEMSRTDREQELRFLNLGGNTDDDSP